MRFGRLDREDATLTARRSPVRQAFDRTCRNPRTGKVAIAQPPNLPLGVFLVATVVRLVAHPTGTLGTTVAVVGGVALAWWAGDEVLRGDSLLRRALGGVVLVAMAVGLLMR